MRTATANSFMRMLNASKMDALASPVTRHRLLCRSKPVIECRLMEPVAPQRQRRLHLTRLANSPILAFSIKGIMFPK
jgi:hypothetical protein